MVWQSSAFTRKNNTARMNHCRCGSCGAASLGVIHTWGSDPTRCGVVGELPPGTASSGGATAWLSVPLFDPTTHTRTNSYTHACTYIQSHTHMHACTPLNIQVKNGSAKSKRTQSMHNWRCCFWGPTRAVLWRVSGGNRRPAPGQRGGTRNRGHTVHFVLE